MQASKEVPTYTQRLSSAIDKAFEEYKAGDVDAAAKLYKALQEQAHNVAIHHLDWKQVAVLECDIVHRAMMALKDFRGQSRVSTWFYRLAVNEANRALRDQVNDREHLVPLTTSDDEGEEQERQIEAKRIDHDAIIDLKRLRRRLPPNQAVVVALEQQGFSLSEIAQKMGVPLGTIRGRYRLLKKRVQKTAPGSIARSQK